MASLAEFDQRLEQVIRELTMRIAIPRWSEFETVWEAAIRVCDRYELGKIKREPTTADQPPSQEPEPTTSSPEPCATDAPVQTHPPVAA
jgi:hypothetical protein